MDDQYCMSETNGTRLCTGTLDVDRSPQIHSNACIGSSISKAFNSYQTIYPEFLKEQNIKPFKIKYYCEKRDSDFESKMHEVLLVYKQFDENGILIVPDDYKLTITVSYDEKPGIQAVSNTALDLRPTTEHGEAIPLVSESHKSSDFIEFLKILDKKHPS